MKLKVFVYASMTQDNQVKSAILYTTLIQA